MSIPNIKLHHKFAQNYLANLYNANTSAEVLSETEILDNFMNYRNAIVEMFEHIAQAEMEGFFAPPPQCEKNYDLRVRDAVVIPLRCIFAVLYVVGRHGVFENGHLVVSKKVFKEQLKKIKKVYIQTAIQILSDNGFFFDCGVFSKGDDFQFSYPDNNSVITGLFSFSNTIAHMDFNSTCYDYGKAFRSFILLNTRLYKWRAEEEKPYELYDLLRFIQKPEDKKVAELFHNKMLQQGYSFQYDMATFGGRGAHIRYQKGKHDPYALLRAKPCTGRNFTAHATGGCCERETSNLITEEASRSQYKRDGMPYLGFKMRTLGKHSDFIQNCSTTFKDGFDKVWKDCANPECPYGTEDILNCECCVIYTNEEKSHAKCTNTGWEYTWDRTMFPLNEADFDSYFYLINQKHKKSVRV